MGEPAERHSSGAAVGAQACESIIDRQQGVLLENRQHPLLGLNYRSVICRAYPTT